MAQLVLVHTEWRVYFNEAFKLRCVGIAGQLLYSKLL